MNPFHKSDKPAIAVDSFKKKFKRKSVDNKIKSLKFFKKYKIKSTQRPL
jgi:hypothetical protein